MLVVLKSLPILLSAIATLLIPEDRLLSSIPWFYAIGFATTLFAGFDRQTGILAYFRPSTLMAAYVSFFFAMGTYAFANGWILDVVGQQEYYQLPFLRHATFFFLCAIWVTVCAGSVAPLRASTFFGNVAHQRELRHVLVSPWHVGFSLAIAVLSVCVDLQLPGGVGSFSSAFFVFAAYHISYVCSVSRFRGRYLIYLGICAVIAVCFYSDRRLVAFYAFTVSFIELHNHQRTRIRLRTLVAYTGVFAAVIVLVIAMSIQRGVGEFGARSVVESFSYVDDYLQSDWSKTMLFHNFEGPATTFHSYNAADYILDTHDLAYGSTIGKVFFLPIPRSVCHWKPRSMVDEYTTHFYPLMRADGVSFVPNLYTEALWNFGVGGGLLFLVVLFLLLNRIYDLWMCHLGRSPANDVLFLSSHSFLLFFYRGCGLELYVLFIGVFFVISRMYMLIPSRSSTAHGRVCFGDSRLSPPIRT